MRNEGEFIGWWLSFATLKFLDMACTAVLMDRHGSGVEYNLIGVVAWNLLGAWGLWLFTVALVAGLTPPLYYSWGQNVWYTRIWFLVVCTVYGIVVAYDTYLLKF